MPCFQINKWENKFAPRAKNTKNTTEPQIYGVILSDWSSSLLVHLRPIGTLCLKKCRTPNSLTHFDPSQVIQPLNIFLTVSLWSLCKLGPLLIVGFESGPTRNLGGCESHCSGDLDGSWGWGAMWGYHEISWDIMGYRWISDFCPNGHRMPPGLATCYTDACWIVGWSLISSHLQYQFQRVPTLTAVLCLQFVLLQQVMNLRENSILWIAESKYHKVMEEYQFPDETQKWNAGYQWNLIWTLSSSSNRFHQIYLGNF